MATHCTSAVTILATRMWPRRDRRGNHSVIFTTRLLGPPRENMATRPQQGRAVIGGGTNSKGYLASQLPGPSREPMATRPQQGRAAIGGGTNSRVS